MKRTILVGVVVCVLSFAGNVSVKALNGEDGAAGASSVPSPSVTPHPAPAPATASVLRLIKFSGSVADARGIVGITFALYVDQQGGTPLWLETQNVQLDPQGRYTALLGSASGDGLPLEIFTSGEARWLGITVQGRTEQPRVLLVAVPYALKAAEAETLSGKKASDFVTTEQLPEQVQKAVEEQQADSATASETTTTADGKAVVVSGATNFTDTTTDQVVKVTQNGTGYALLGIGTASNAIFGATQAANANVYGIFGQTIGEKGGALIGFANATTGTAVGVQGVTKSATGTAGAFVNTAGGRILLGRGAGNAEVFSVDGSGNVTATSFSGDGSNLSNVGLADAWGLSGNAGTTAGTNFLGTTDDVALELHINSTRVLLLEPNATSPNIIGGFSDNSMAGGVAGGTIGGGGQTGGANQVTDQFGTVSGGTNNQAGNGGLGGDTGPIDATFSTVGGGFVNVASGAEATVAGGRENTASGSDSSIGGGLSNTASGGGSTISGGLSNLASEMRATVSGGENNTASGLDATVGGGSDNTASGQYASIGGGRLNESSGNDSTIGGGRSNLVSAVGATVGGGFGNTVSADNGTIAGGGRTNSLDSTTGNLVTDWFATVGGGGDNQAGDGDGILTNAQFATVAGGQSNTASGQFATVSGGQGNTASSTNAVVAGGTGNTASSSNAFVGGGENNAATQPYATIPGGRNNTASALLSFAAGRRAKAMHQGAFVWADTTDADFPSERSDQFRVRAGGGARFDVTGDDFVDIRDDTTNLINTSTGAVLTIGGAWTDASDRALKENFAPADHSQVLARLVAMPVQRWNYIAEGPEVPRLGPTAQDFYAAFGLGVDNKHISGVDAHGVAFAAIQALYQAILERDDQLEQQRQQIIALQSDLAAVKAALIQHDDNQLAALNSQE